MICTYTLIQNWNSVRISILILQRTAVCETNVTLCFLLNFPYLWSTCNNELKEKVWATFCQCKTMQPGKKAVRSYKKIMDSLSMHPLRARYPVIATNFLSYVRDDDLPFFFTSVVGRQCRICSEIFTKWWWKNTGFADGERLPRFLKIHFFFSYIPRQWQSFFYLRTLESKGDRKMYKSNQTECDSLVFATRNQIIHFSNPVQQNSKYPFRLFIFTKKKNDSIVYQYLSFRDMDIRLLQFDFLLQILSKFIRFVPIHTRCDHPWFGELLERRFWYWRKIQEKKWIFERRVSLLNTSKPVFCNHNLLTISLQATCHPIILVKH